jgi:hypothetical protein
MRVDLRAPRARLERHHEDPDEQHSTSDLTHVLLLPKVTGTTPITVKVETGEDTSFDHCCQ